MESTKLLKVILKELDERKAENVVAVNVSDRTPFSDFYVLATALNQRHALALADDLEDKILSVGGAIKTKEGKNDSGWVLIDAFDVVIHIFTHEQRSHFDLDGLLIK